MLSGAVRDDLNSFFWRQVVAKSNRALCHRLGIPSGNTPSIALILGHPAAKFQRAVRRRFTRVNRVA